MVGSGLGTTYIDDKAFIVLKIPYHPQEYRILRRRGMIPIRQNEKEILQADLTESFLQVQNYHNSRLVPVEGGVEVTYDLEEL